MKLDLSDVTLCAADSANLALTARALQLSMERCKFAEAVLFSHERLDGDFRTVIGPKFSRASYQAFRIKPPPTVETPFALFIEWMATYSSREHGIRVSVSMIISVPAGRAHFSECLDELSATADFACNRKN
jgi:hypothetical protein